jgi:2-iminobutanoate/2-iminopropanoate deaminase
MSSIARAVSPQVNEPQPDTWSNCLVVGGIAYVAGMTASGGDLSDEYTQSKSTMSAMAGSR